jgi:hypothetical protein
MINEYAKKLVENLPDTIKNTKQPITIDLVLDGGAFNGSYLVGAIYFLKEMENRNYIKIRRISGCSIGAFIAFMYFIDKLDMIEPVCEMGMKEYKEKHCLSIVKNIKSHIVPMIPEDICNTINNKLYITYYKIDQQQKIVKSEYKSIDHLLDTIIKSSFVPFVIDGNMTYKNNYIDGITPYMFKTEPGVHVLHLDLLGIDKMYNMFNIKNEKTPTHRILSGLLDIHNFYIKQCNTHMCSYVDEWNIINQSFYHCKLVLEKIIITIIYSLIQLDKCATPYNIHNTLIYKIVVQIIKDVSIILFQQYCI